MEITSATTSNNRRQEAEAYQRPHYPQLVIFNHPIAHVIQLKITPSVLISGPSLHSSQRKSQGTATTKTQPPRSRQQSTITVCRPYNFFARTPRTHRPLFIVITLQLLYQPHPLYVHYQLFKSSKPARQRNRPRPDFAVISSFSFYTEPV